MSASFGISFRPAAPGWILGSQLDARPWGGPTALAQPLIRVRRAIGSETARRRGLIAGACAALQRGITDTRMEIMARV
jgi:hypothetical protein